MHIVYVSDGKAGHRSQAIGLFKAMQRQSTQSITFEEISIEKLAIFSLVMGVFKKSVQNVERVPDYILGVGSHTQLRVLLLGKVYKNAKTVILMKPNFPFFWFDFAVIPEHDEVQASDRVIVTQGALNPIVNEQRHQQNRILIALGGSSKRHQWNAEKVLQNIESIVENNLHAEIILTTSRRTPNEFLAQLEQHHFAEKLHIFPVEQTPQGWIFEEMQLAEAVWVTEDSVSMIYEALTAGCKVGVIMIDRLKEDRITQSIDQAVVKKLIATQVHLSQLPIAQTFKEADRVATYLLAK
ncbi:nucleoside-diphosphate sugar epimerase [Acinetobacter defluvii]|uniref:ELM1/GtrOC1 family putative glycosyltransferase n=1 Tax=Acinetobacter defluvii TaxID=1871111 RepID=UPI00148FA114|nr:ELM1/GtrOC1 family putative glycosyltransferase [Acinetobacter defluvii]NNP73890.1 nucleoside-diphosphate sugar epimerase [Acinetobacter defluvii]